MHFPINVVLARDEEEELGLNGMKVENEGGDEGARIDAPASS